MGRSASLVQWQNSGIVNRGRQFDSDRGLCYTDHMSFSRLGNHEKTKLIRQSVLLFLGGVAIIALFIFGLLPFYTRLLMKNTQTSKLPTATPTVNIPSPSLIAPFTSTNSAQVAITRTAQSGLSLPLLVILSLIFK